MDANLQKYILENCVSISEHKLFAQYDEMLNEAYSFGDVGGAFVHMLPSEVLEKVDRVAYHTGFCDWLDMMIKDGEIEEIEGEYYTTKSVEDATTDWEILKENAEAEE